MKLSVIVPAYNTAPWLPRCLDSLLHQTHQDLEILVVDDGSRDNTREILEAYRQKDPRIVPLFQENSGVTGARLHGLRESSGEWIGFVDADDVVEPEMYEHLLQNARTYEADISHCGFQMVFEDGRIHYFHNSGKLFQHDRDTALKELLRGTLIEPGLCNKLFRRSLLEPLLQDGALDPGIRINEDLLMNFMVFSQAERSVFEDICPYHYMVRQGSASRQKLNLHKVCDPVRVKEKILELAPESVLPEARKAYLSTCITRYGSVVLSGQQELAPEGKKLRRLLIAHRDWAPLLSKKQQLLFALIRFTPWAYRAVYGFYTAHLQQHPYQ